MNRIMIAGTKSGVGKTTVSMGIMATLSKRMKVQAYKVGPDYIDPAFHTFITSRNCRNLDSYMMNQDMIKYLFKENMNDADMAVVEGVMGLFDGAEVGNDIGTSTSVAKILDIPVILVVDGSNVASSLAATVKGFDTFDKNLKISGVIINNVGSEAHYDLLKRAIEYHTDVVPCGYLIKNKELSLPERHLGLVPAGELNSLTDIFDNLALQIEKTIDIDKIMKIASATKDIEVDYAPVMVNEEPVRIAIAKDKAFNFYYQDALDLLEKYNAVKWVPFSPINDKSLPENIHGIYLGGGFPEVFAKELSANKAIQSDLIDKLNDGIPYVAECGALMYLCERLVDLEGIEHDMLGWLEGKTTMQTRLQRFGYATLTTSEETVFGEADMIVNVHEFHRSKAEVNEKEVYKLEKKRYNEVIKSWNCGYKKNNGVAAYAHIHFASNLAFGNGFVKSCLNYKKKV